MHLAINLLPHLKSKPNAVIANVSSVLGFIPFSIVGDLAPSIFLHPVSSTQALALATVLFSIPCSSDSISITKKEFNFPKCDR